MSEIEALAEAGRIAVRRLRREKLEKGFGFMISSEELPKGQVYIEYADGAIHIVQPSENKLDLLLVRKLEDEEISKLREEFHLD